MRGGDHKSAADRLRTREVEAAVLRLRIKGQTWPDISSALGYSLRAVQYSFQRALNRVSVPDALNAKRELIEKCRMLEAALWETFDKATDAHERANVGGKILACQQRMSALTGSDVPARLAVMVARDGVDDDERSVAQLRANLSVDELRQMYQLAEKARGRAPIETSAKALPAAPDFDQPVDAGPMLGLDTQPAQPPAVAIGETMIERVEREAKRPWTPLDSEIAAVEDRIGLLDGNDAINRQPLEFKIRDLKRRRDEWLKNR